MPEPTSTTAAAMFTMTTTSATVSVIAFMGIPLGLRLEVLIAGFLGSLCGIILLNTAPGSTDTWLNLIKTTFRRMAVSLASCITAGYLTPLFLLIANLPLPLTLAVACVIGAGAQHFLNAAIRWVTPKRQANPTEQEGAPK